MDISRLSSPWLPQGSCLSSFIAISGWKDQTLLWAELRDSPLHRVTPELQSCPPQGAELWNTEEKGPAWWGNPGERETSLAQLLGTGAIPGPELCLTPAFPCASSDCTNWPESCRETPAPGWKDEMK